MPSWLQSNKRKNWITAARRAVRDVFGDKKKAAVPIIRPTIDARQPPEWMHDGQRKLWATLGLDIIACAGTQGGKTASEPHWLLREIQRCAPLIKSLGYGRFIYAGPTLELLKAQAISTFKELFQEQLQLGRLIEGNKPVFRFSEDGLQRLLGFSDCPVTVVFAYTKDSSNLESMTACAGVWDEAGQKQNKYESYGAYNRRLKVARSTTFGNVWDSEAAEVWWREWYGEPEGQDATFGRRLWGTTPYEWNWFKAEVVDRALREEGGFRFVNWESWKNPRVSEAECRAELTNGMPLWRWEMMYLGLFHRPGGMIFDTFDYDIDTCTPFPIPASWRLYPGVDFGSIHMAGVIIAEDPDNRALYVIDEYLESTRTFKEHADGIRKGRALRPGAGGSHQEEGWREAFRQNGLALDEPPMNDVDVQIMCVYALLKTHDLKIFRSCKGLIDQLQTYSRELGKDGQPTEEIANKSAYHFADALRYIIAKLRPIKSEGWGGNSDALAKLAQLFGGKK